MISLTFWLAFSNALQLVFGLARSILLARWLGVGGFGELGFVLALVSMADAFTQAGLAQVVTRDTAASPRRDGAIFGSAAGLRTALAAAAAGVIWALAGPWAALLVFGTLGQVGVAVLRAKLLRNEQVAANLLPGVLAVSLIWLLSENFEPSVPLALAALAASSLAASGGQIWLAVLRLSRPVSWSKGTARVLLLESWPVWAGGLLVAGFYRLDVIMLRWLLPAGLAAESIGYYQVAYSLTEAGHFMLGALVTVAFPVFARTRPGAEKLGAAFSGMSRFGYIAGGSAAAAAVLLGSAAVMMLYGPAYARSVIALYILSPTLLLVLMNSLGSSLLISRHKQVESMLICAVMLVFNFGLNMVVIPRFGFPGAAAARVATEALGFLLVGARCRALLRAGPRGRRERGA